MSFLTMFAALALLLSAVGIYSMIACTTSRRTHEIGLLRNYTRAAWHTVRRRDIRSIGIRRRAFSAAGNRGSGVVLARAKGGAGGPSDRVAIRVTRVSSELRCTRFAC